MIETYNKAKWVKEIKRLRNEIRDLKRRLKISGSSFDVLWDQISSKLNKIGEEIQRIGKKGDIAKIRRKKLSLLNERRLLKRFKETLIRLIGYF